MDFEKLIKDNKTSYTGPLWCAANLGFENPSLRDAGSHYVLLYGLAKVCDENRITHVRIEMTPEEAKELSICLFSMAKAAMAGPKDKDKD